MMRSRWSTL